MIAWYIYAFFTLPQPPPPPQLQTRYLSPDPLLLVTSSSLRGSPQCIAFKRYCTCQHLMQYSVMSVVQKGVFTTRSLAISAKDFAAAFECSLVWHNEEKKILRTPNCDHTTTTTTTTITTTSTTTIQILQGLFCICECRLSATFVRHGIVSISLYFNHGKSKTLVSYLRRTGGTFSTNTKSLDKRRGSSKQVYIFS